MVRHVIAAALFVWSTLADAQPAIRSLVETVDISGLAVSPDRRMLAFRTDQASIGRNAHEFVWHVARLDQDERVGTAGYGGHALWSGLGGLLTAPPVWSPDSRFIYYRALSDGAVQVWQAAADGSGARAVTTDDADIISFDLASDGRTLTYRVGATREAIRRAEEAEYDAGVLVDASVDPGQPVYRGVVVNGRRASQRLTGSWFSRGGLLWDALVGERRLDLETFALGDELPSTRGQPEASAAPSALLRVRRGDEVAAVAERNARPILSVRRANGQMVGCEAPECMGERIVALAWRPAHDELLFTVSDAAQSQSLYVWEVGNARVREIARSAGLLGGGRDPASPCMLTEIHAYCVAAGAVSPPRIERIDLDDGVRSVLFDPNTQMRDLGGIRVEQLIWADTAGRTFTGKLLLPENAPPDPIPLFITYYSCPGFLRGGTGDEWPLAPMAHAGIAALCINAARDGDPDDPVDRYRVALSGVRSVIELLAARGTIDRERVGMGGLSFGAEVTMWATMNSDLLAAASIASGQIEPGYYWLNGVRGRDNHSLLRQYWGLGAPDETPERWLQVSPALNTGSIQAPLLMQLPEQEAATVRELHARLSNSATPVELYVFPHESHVKTQPRHVYAANRRNFDWFRFWLQDYIDPDPAKAAQYRRWRTLAERRRASRVQP